MTKTGRIYGKIRYISLGDDGFDVSCVHASWADNISIFGNKDFVSDDADDYKRSKRK